MFLGSAAATTAWPITDRGETLKMVLIFWHKSKMRLVPVIESPTSPGRQLQSIEVHKLPALFLLFNHFLALAAAKLTQEYTPLWPIKSAGLWHSGTFLSRLTMCTSSSARPHLPASAPSGCFPLTTTRAGLADAASPSTRDSGFPALALASSFGQGDKIDVRARKVRVEEKT